MTFSLFRVLTKQIDMAEYSLNVQGYYKQGMTGGVPSSPGLFIVYRGIHDTENNRAILKELLYIGESSNLESCMNNADNIRRYSESLQDQETLFFCYSRYDGDSQIRKELVNMLVSVTLPTLNDLDTEVNVPEGAVINIEGDRHAFLPSKINIA